MMALLRQRVDRMNYLEIESELMTKLERRLADANVIGVEGNRVAMSLEVGRYMSAIAMTMLPGTRSRPQIRVDVRRCPDSRTSNLWSRRLADVKFRVRNSA